MQRIIKFGVRGCKAGLLIAAAVAFSSVEIKAQTGAAYADAVLSHGPTAYYRLNETGDPSTGTLAAVDSVGGLNGLYGNSAYTIYTSPILAGPTPSIGFPGFESGNTSAGFNQYTASSFISCSNGWNFNTNTVTITAWINPFTPTQAGNSGIVFHRGSSDASGLIFTKFADPNGNSTLGYTWNNEGNTTSWDSQIAPPVNTWSFVALVITPTNATINLYTPNAMLSAVHTYKHASVSFSTNCTIGADATANGALNMSGLVDEVAIFNQSLPQAQLTSLYAAGSGIGNVPLSVFTQPVDKTGYVGLGAVFTALASGAPPLGYQWKVGTNGVYVNLNEGGFLNASHLTTIDGSQSSTLFLSNVASDDPANYIVVITNSYGSVTSRVATLTVQQTTAEPILLTAGDPLNSSSFNSAGNWSSGQMPSIDSAYLTAGFSLRTPNSPDPGWTFGGGLLMLSGIGTNGGNPSLLTKQNPASNPLTLSANIMFTNWGCIFNASPGLATLLGNMNFASGGGQIWPGDGSVVVKSTMFGSGPLYIGGLTNTGSSQLTKNYVCLAGDFSGFTGSIMTPYNVNICTHTLIFSNAVNEVFSGTVATGPSNSVVVASAGKLTFSSSHSYSGPTLINSGTLALRGTASISQTPSITIAAGATFDVSALTSTFSLGADQVLAGAGATGTILGNLNLGSGSLTLVYTNGAPALTVTNGTLVFNDNSIIVNVAGNELALGSSYKLVSKSTGGSVSGSVAGTKVGLIGGGLFGASLSISNGELYMLVGIDTTPRNLVSLLASDGNGHSCITSATNWSNKLLPNATNDYIAPANCLVRTPPVSGNQTFGGHSLTLVGIATNTATSLITKNTGISNVFNCSLILTNRPLIQSANGGNIPVFTGSIQFTNGGGEFYPGNSDIIVQSTLLGTGPLMIGAYYTASGAALTYSVVFSGIISNYTGTIGTAPDSVSSNATYNVVFGTPDGQVLNAALNTIAKYPVVIKSSGKLTFAASNSYSGPTTIKNGTLALSGLASIANTPRITIASNATFDVSGLNTTFSLVSTQTLFVSAATGTIKGGLNMNTGSLILNYDGNTPTLSIASGVLTMSDNTVTITNNSTQLPIGSYKIVSSAGGSVAGSVANSTVTVAGGGAAATAHLKVVGGELYLVVTAEVTPAPIASFTATPSIGKRPLLVTFTDTTTGSPTNLVWTFGDGFTTNSTVAGGTVVHTYTVAGSYTVSLVASGAGGSTTNTQTGLITVSLPASPRVSTVTVSGGDLVLNGNGGTGSGYSYYILTSTNVAQPLGNWTSIATNSFKADGSFSWTNSRSAGTPMQFFRLQLP